MKYYSVFAALVCSLFISTSFAVNANAAGHDVFSPYSQYTRLDADTLDTGTVAFKGELIFDFVFHKLGNYWYTRSDVLGLNKYHNYDTSRTKDNKWEDTYGQTFLFNIGFKPVDWFFADFGFAMIGDYADKYWIPVNHEHRMDTWDRRAPRIEWNNAKVGIKNDWASLTYYRNYLHMDWRYEGDMFDLFPVADNPDNYLRYSGHHAPDYWELKTKGIWGELSAIYGEEPNQDYKQGIYIKYKNIFGSNINFYYADHRIPFGNPNTTDWNNLFESSKDEGDTKERMRTFELSTDFKIKDNTLQVGAIYRPFRLGWDYQYVEDVGAGNGDGGTRYKLKTDTTNGWDALGASVKWTMPEILGIDLFKVGYEYRGLVAGNRQKADISLEKHISKYWHAYGGYYYQKPLLEAMPLVYSASGSGPILFHGRGSESPFWVWWRNPATGFDNRETSAFSFVFTYDPTPSTWFYRFEPNKPMDYNLNPEEDAPFSFATKINFEKYYGTLDRQTSWESDGSTVWEDSYSNGTNAPDRYIASLYVLTQFVKNKTRILYDFEVGEDLATLSYPYPDKKGGSGREVFTTPNISYFKTSLSVKRDPYFFKAAYLKNFWGPEDWHRNFGSTFDELYLAHFDRNIGEWFNVGAEYVGARKTDRDILSAIDGDGKLNNETGYFDEIRIFFKVLFGAVLNFGTKEEPAPFIVEYDKTPPQTALKAKPETIYPENGQKAIIEPWVSDYSGIDVWNIKITDAEGKVVKEYSGSIEPPYELEWDGKSESFKEKLPDGVYSVVLEAKDNYGNYAQTEPLMITIASVPKPEPKPEPQIEDTEIVETERGLVITLGAKVLFDFNKFTLKKGAQKTLKEVAELLNIYPDNKISVEGHTDWKGSVSYNQKLSENRAKSVRDFLVKEGVSSDRIKMVGFGKLKPVATNETAAGREQNRRVEIVILKDGEE